MDNSFIIDNLLEQDENVRLEYKAAVNLDAIAQAITAFINTKGGDLVVGIDDGKQVVGVPDAGAAIQEIRKYLVKHIKPCIKPGPLIFFLIETCVIFFIKYRINIID